MIEKDGNRIEWEYDALYRLTDERRYGIDGLSLLQDTTFTYDAAGNRETMTVDGQTTTYHYNVLDQLIRIDDPDQITH
ncbi:MAG: RHS repeat protein, partial [Bacteroidetes bacterium]